MLNYQIFLKAEKLDSVLSNSNLQSIKEYLEYDEKYDFFRNTMSGEIFEAEHRDLSILEEEKLEYIFAGKRLEFM